MLYISLAPCLVFYDLVLKGKSCHLTRKLMLKLSNKYKQYKTEPQYEEKKKTERVLLLPKNVGQICIGYIILE